MRDTDKKKKQLISELEELRQKIVEIKALEIKHKQVKERGQAHIKMLKSLHEASQALVASLDFLGVVDKCASIAKEMITTDGVVIYLMNSKGTQLEPIAAEGTHTDPVISLSPELGEGITGRVAMTGKAEILNRVDLTDTSNQKHRTPVDQESLLSAPLKVKEKVIGVITLTRSGKGEFSEENLEFLENLANISASAIENARLYGDKEQADVVKSLFIANMSHEIRTPLNAILGFTDLIKQSTQHLLSPEEQTFFETIDRSGKRLMKTVHGILDISQIAAGVVKLEPRPFQLTKLIQQVLSDLRRLAESKGLELTYASEVPDGFIKADEYYISQALINVIGNAIKYTEKGRIAVSLKDGEKKLILTVQDTGIGISEEYQGQLFDIFSQESTGYTKRFQGVGLGLALTKCYLDMNNVEINIQSSQGIGTTVTLTFEPEYGYHPKLEVETREKPVMELPQELSAKPLVLVVEDDPNSQQLVGLFLKQSYETCFAVSVDEAKQRLKKQSADLILLDLSLTGEKDGLDLVRYLRQLKRWKNIPIIALTAHAFITDRDNCLAAGCNDYLVKPIKQKDLLEAIKQQTLRK